MSPHQLIFEGHEFLITDKKIFFLPSSWLAFNVHQLLILVEKL